MSDILEGKNHKKILNSISKNNLYILEEISEKESANYSKMDISIISYNADHFSKNSSESNLSNKKNKKNKNNKKKKSFHFPINLDTTYRHSISTINDNEGQIENYIKKLMKENQSDESYEMSDVSMIMAEVTSKITKKEKTRNLHQNENDNQSITEDEDISIKNEDMRRGTINSLEKNKIQILAIKEKRRSSQMDPSQFIFQKRNIKKNSVFVKSKNDKFSNANKKMSLNFNLKNIFQNNYKEDSEISEKSDNSEISDNSEDSEKSENENNSFNFNIKSEKIDEKEKNNENKIDLINDSNININILEYEEQSNFEDDKNNLVFDSLDTPEVENKNINNLDSQKLSKNIMSGFDNFLNIKNNDFDVLVVNQHLNIKIENFEENQQNIYKVGNLTKNEDIIKKDNFEENQEKIKKENLTKNKEIIKTKNFEENQDIIKKQNLTKNEDIIKKENLTINEDIIKTKNLTKNEDIIKTKNLTKNQEKIKKENLTINKDIIKKQNFEENQEKIKKQNFQKIEENKPLINKCMEIYENLSRKQSVKKMKKFKKVFKKTFSIVGEKKIKKMETFLNELNISENSKKIEIKENQKKIQNFLQTYYRKKIKNELFIFFSEIKKKKLVKKFLAKGLKILDKIKKQKKKDIFVEFIKNVYMRNIKKKEIILFNKEKKINEKIKRDILKQIFKNCQKKTKFIFYLLKKNSLNQNLKKEENFFTKNKKNEKEEKIEKIDKIKKIEKMQNFEKEEKIEKIPNFEKEEKIANLEKEEKIQKIQNYKKEEKIQKKINKKKTSFDKSDSSDSLSDIQISTMNKIPEINENNNNQKIPLKNKQIHSLKVLRNISSILKSLNKIVDEKNNKTPERKNLKKIENNFNTKNQKKIKNFEIIKKKINQVINNKNEKELDKTIIKNKNFNKNKTTEEKLKINCKKTFLFFLNYFILKKEKKTKEIIFQIFKKDLFKNYFCKNEKNLFFVNSGFLNHLFENLAIKISKKKKYVFKKFQNFN